MYGWVTPNPQFGISQGILAKYDWYKRNLEFHNIVIGFFIVWYKLCLLQSEQTCSNRSSGHWHMAEPAWGVQKKICMTTKYWEMLIFFTNMMRALNSESFISIFETDVCVLLTLQETYMMMMILLISYWPILINHTYLKILLIGQNTSNTVWLITTLPI